MSPVLAQTANPCGEDPGPICLWVLERTNSEILARFSGVVLPTVLQILFIILLAYVANRLVRRAIKRFVRNLAQEGMTKLGSLRKMAPFADTTPMDLGRATMRAETIAGVLRSVATFVIWTIAAFLVLGTVGVQLGPLIASAGIAGVALGFGAQSLVRDFLSGIFMLMEDQYGIGDIVDTGETTGVIEGITLRTTRLRDVYGTVWYVPNGQIMRVGNFSQEWARSLLDIGVAYDTDISLAMSVIKRVADELWQDPEWSSLILEEPEVWGVENFGQSEIVIRLVLKTVPNKQWVVNREIRKRLKAAFDAEGIEIPFPQRTIWVRENGGDALTPPDGRNQEETSGKRG